jgi:hypothetical protein
MGKQAGPISCKNFHKGVSSGAAASRQAKMSGREAGVASVLVVKDIEAHDLAVERQEDRPHTHNDDGRGRGRPRAQLTLEDDAV